MLLAGSAVLLRASAFENEGLEEPAKYFIHLDGQDLSDGHDGDLVETLAAELERWTDTCVVGSDDACLTDENTIEFRVRVGSRFEMKDNMGPDLFFVSIGEGSTEDLGAMLFPQSSWYHQWHVETDFTRTLWSNRFIITPPCE